MCLALCNGRDPNTPTEYSCSARRLRSELHTAAKDGLSVDGRRLPVTPLMPVTFLHLRHLLRCHYVNDTRDLLNRKAPVEQVCHHGAGVHENRPEQICRRTGQCDHSLSTGCHTDMIPRAKNPLKERRQARAPVTRGPAALPATLPRGTFWPIHRSKSEQFPFGSPPRLISYQQMRIWRDR